MKKLMLICLIPAFGACVSVPDVYLIDRHTVMELEAAGEWPELEQRFSDKALNSGAIDIEDRFSTERKEKVFTLLQGEFVKQDSGTKP
ncbi:MAG: hypothetical protein OEZ43_06475 [Gammaproteobacteria bacterium]|nr:hypothetical protein [Gammaproteobacteria bacterium]